MTKRQGGYNNGICRPDFTFRYRFGDSRRPREKDGTFSLPHNSTGHGFEMVSADATDYDVYTDPAFSHAQGNIYYQALITPMKTMFDDDLCTNPVHSFLACNIYHREHDWYSRFDSSLSSGSDD